MHLQLLLAFTILFALDVVSDGSYVMNTAYDTLSLDTTTTTLLLTKI